MLTPKVCPAKDRQHEDRQYYDIRYTDEEESVISYAEKFTDDVLISAARMEDRDNKFCECLDRSSELGLSELFMLSTHSHQNIDLSTIIRIAEELGRGDANVTMHAFSSIHALLALTELGLVDQLGGSLLAEILQNKKKINYLANGIVTSSKQRLDQDEILVEYVNQIYDDKASAIVGVASYPQGSGVICYIVEAGHNHINYKAESPMGLSHSEIGNVQIILDCSDPSVKIFELPKEKRMDILKLDSKRGLIFGAILQGLLTGAYRYAFKYAKERISFGKPIIRHQAIALRLGEMAINVEASRLLILKLASTIDSGNNTSIDAQQLAIQLESSAQYVTQEAIQILGRHGYVETHPAAKWYRDAITLIHVIFSIISCNNCKCT